MKLEGDGELARRAAVYSALGDPARLAIVEHLQLGDAAPSRLQSVLPMPANLLTHHVGVLERAGIIRRSRSQADRRRIYLSLVPEGLAVIGQRASFDRPRIVFVCTENAARSQLAAAIWNQRSELPVASAGTNPAWQVHPGALAAARRHELPMAPVAPRRLTDVLAPDDLVVAVCDNAYEEMRSPVDWLHWSIPDPSAQTDARAFDHAISELDDRISRLLPAITANQPDADPHAT